MVRRSNDLSKGQSVKKLLSLNGSDLKTLDRRELAHVVSTMASAANKRITRLEKAGQPISDTVDRFSVAGKSRNELMKEFRRVKQFMNAENQSLSGQARIARESSKQLAQAMTGKQSGKDFNKAYKDFQQTLGTNTGEGTPYATFWKAYDRLRETNPIVRDKAYKYKVLARQISVMKANKGISIDELHERMNGIVSQTYGDIQEQMEQERPQDAFTLGTR